MIGENSSVPATALGRVQEQHTWRRARRYFWFAVTSCTLAVGFLYAMPSTILLSRLSLALGYISLAFLGGSLFVGPWNVLWGYANPVSTGVRRDLGIWAGILGLVHTVLGLQVHMNGNFWLYFFNPPESPHLLPLRFDPFGFANFAGLGAVCVLLLLLALSNNYSLRRLGVQRWKALQQWNYVCFILTVAHSVAYQYMERRTVLFLALFSGIVLVVGAMQFAGFRKRRAQKIYT